MLVSAIGITSKKSTVRMLCIDLLCQCIFSNMPTELRKKKSRNGNRKHKGPLENKHHAEQNA